MSEQNIKPEIIDKAILTWLSYNTWQSYGAIVRQFGERFKREDLISSMRKLLDSNKIKPRNERGQSTKYGLY